ncbi:MAG: hypothetical protein WD534_06585 [Phycisphaeraceae bacterium]
MIASAATTSTAWPAMLLAQVTSSEHVLPERLRAIGDHWGDTTLPANSVIVAGSILLAVMLLVALWIGWKQRRAQPRPWRVFHRVARHMGLTWREQWLLVRIARHGQLPSPLTLMLSRRTLGYYTKQYVAGRPPRRRATVVRRVVAIRQALFDPPDSLPPHTPATPGPA